MSLCLFRIQAGQYNDAHEMLNDLLKLEEESLGARTDKLADIYQLMSKTKSEVTALTLSLFFLSFLCGKKGFYTSHSVSVNLQHPPPLPPTQAMQGLKRAQGQCVTINSAPVHGVLGEICFLTFFGIQTGKFLLKADT